MASVDMQNYSLRRREMFIDQNITKPPRRSEGFGLGAINISLLRTETSSPNYPIPFPIRLRHRRQHVARDDVLQLLTLAEANDLFNRSRAHGAPHLDASSRDMRRQ
jgi:hypothetical protein